MDPDRTRGDLAHLRMAALLHDVGHGLCSHASEQIYQFLTDLREFKNQKKFAKNAEGEILSYLIVKSRTFENWFQKYVVEGCQAPINLETVGQIILGRHADKDRHFLAQIVSSPYDAAKLDYIARDSYYCGLALTVDLARFYSMISTAKMAGHRVLVLRSYVPLEQILFSKMTLFGSVYHHQKVKCLDSMLRSLIQHIVENPSQCAIDVEGGIKISFSEPVQYLYVTDGEFCNQIDGFGDSYVKKMLRRFKRRDLFVRCLEISRRTVKNWEEHGRGQLVKLSQKPYDLHTVERKIHEGLPGHLRTECDLRDVLLSVPGVPSLKQDNAFIQTSPTAPIEPIEEYFPVEQWVGAYGDNKWRSFVYAPRQYATAVRDAALSVLREEDLGLEIDVDRSNQTCHL